MPGAHRLKQVPVLSPVQLRVLVSLAKDSYPPVRWLGTSWLLMVGAALRYENLACSRVETVSRAGLFGEAGNSRGTGGAGAPTWLVTSYGCGCAKPYGGW